MIFKGLIEWLWGLFWEACEWAIKTLMNVFSMDLSYFERTLPVTTPILNIMFGVGWALLLGNVVFQAAKSMMSGLGFEGDDPKILAARTLIFAFLLMASRQICDIGLGISSRVISLLQIPSSVGLPSFSLTMFGFEASWLVVIIMGVILFFQMVKFFFQVGERYVILGILTILSPLAFAMGVSRNTVEIFKGWVRMFGSMCLMMVMNVVFVKMLVSGMARVPYGPGAIPWLIFMIALMRVARKMEQVVAKIGLNPAATGNELRSGMPGMMLMMVGRSLASSVINSRMAAAGQRAAAPNVARGAGRGHEHTGTGFGQRANPASSPIDTSGGQRNTNAHPGGDGGIYGFGRDNGVNSAHTTRQGAGKDNSTISGQQTGFAERAATAPPQAPVHTAQGQRPATTESKTPVNPPLHRGAEHTSPAPRPEHGRQPGLGNQTAAPVDTAKPIQTGEPPPANDLAHAGALSRAARDGGQANLSSNSAVSTTPINISSSAQTTQQGASVHNGGQNVQTDANSPMNAQSSQVTTQTQGSSVSMQNAQHTAPINVNSTGAAAPSTASKSQGQTPASKGHAKSQTPHNTKSPQNPQKTTQAKNTAPLKLGGHKPMTPPAQKTPGSKHPSAKMTHKQEPFDINENFNKQLTSDPTAENNAQAEDGVPNGQ